MYENIVVGIDNSEFSNAGVIEVGNRIRIHGGTATLVHGVYFDQEEFGYAPDQLTRRIEKGMEISRVSKDMLHSEFGIDAEMLVREGEPPEVISRVAAEKNADLIVMGTHGRSGIKRTLMGSVTSGVIGNAPCDVLVVKKPCSECTGTYSSILTAFDGSDFSKHALQRVCRLSKNENASVSVVYSIPRYEEMIGFFKTDAIRKNLHQEADKILNTASEIAAGYGVSIQTETAEGHPSDAIVNTAIHLKSDLIVMGTYGWRGLNRAIMGSTTERVLGNAPCPILVVRGGSDERI